MLGCKCRVDHPSTSTLLRNDRVSFPWEIWKIPVKPLLKISIILAERMCNIRNLIFPCDQFIFTYSNITYLFLFHANDIDGIYFWGIVFFLNLTNTAFEEIFLFSFNILWTIMFHIFSLHFLSQNKHNEIK